MQLTTSGLTLSYSLLLRYLCMCLLNTDSMGHQLPAKKPVQMFDNTHGKNIFFLISSLNIPEAALCYSHSFYHCLLQRRNWHLPLHFSSRSCRAMRLPLSLLSSSRQINCLQLHFIREAFQPFYQVCCILWTLLSIY